MIRRGRGRIGGERMAWRGLGMITQVLCFAVAMWNGKDPILKERPVRADQ